MKKKRVNLSPTAENYRFPSAMGIIGGVIPIDNPYETEPDEDGFYHLVPKAGTIIRKAGANAEETVVGIKPKKINVTIIGEMSIKDYSPEKVKTILEKTINFIKNGKFSKAYDMKNVTLFKEFRDALYAISDDNKNTDEAKAIFEVAPMLLIAGKSFYEYDNKQRQFISNELYDQILNKYLSFGFTEPTGIVPDGEKKTTIKYTTLHNNMDKAYRIYEIDPIPDGVKESDSIEAWLKRLYAVFELSPSMSLTLELTDKIDGISVNGTKDGNLLVKPQTRGDQSASVKIPGLSGLQLSEDKSDDSKYGIQFEAYCTDADRIDASDYLGLPKPYVSCRSAAAGIIGRLESSEDDGLLKYLNLFPINTEGLSGSYASRVELIDEFKIWSKSMKDQMKAKGYKNISRQVINGNMKYLLKKIASIWEETAKRRPDLPYPIDGIVISVYDDEYQKILGRDGRTNRWQIALKFNPVSTTGEVDSIYLDSGKKGFRTVQINLKTPVFIDDVKYDHVPALSAGIFTEMNPRVGMKVKLTRTGDVMPAITVISPGKGKPIPLPTTCPGCGKPLVIKNKKLFCNNLMCKDNIVGRMVSLFEAIDLEGYSDSYAESFQKIIEGKSLVKGLLGLSPEKLAGNNMNGKLYATFQKKFIDALETTDDYKILGGLGIPDVGPQSAKVMLRYVGGDWDKLADIIKNLRYASLENMLGKKTGNKVFEYLSANETYIAIYEDLCALKPHVKYVGSTQIPDKRVGHTGGDLSADVLALCKKLNFEVVDGSSFDILITSSKESNSGKMKRARSKDLPIMTQDEFIMRYDR